MRLKNSILSRWFGSKAGEETKEGTKEEQIEERQEEGGAPSVEDPARLKLLLDDALCQLWELCEARQELPEPEIRLAGVRQPELLSEEKLEYELLRLGQKIETTAKARFEEAKSRWETAAPTGGEEEEGGREDGEPGQGGAAEDVESLQDAPAGSGEPGQESKVEVIPRLDAQVVVFLTQDLMTAWVLAYPPSGGGKELERGMLEDALRENGVDFGVDEAALEGLPQDEERYFHLYLVAEGNLPAHGKDGYVIDAIPRTDRRELAMTEGGQIDYMQLNTVRGIEEGDLICEIVAPTAGEAGSTVTGKTLPPKAGRKATVPKGRNTELSEDGTMLKAAKTGRIEFNGCNFEVKTALEISNNVDYSTGNINFLGDVHIRGDICGGVEVKASGNVTVDGVVEGCTIEAGGDLVVAKGIKGDDQAVIRTGRSIYARYIENSVLCARENLITDFIVNCDSYCDGAVNACSGRGIIIGGKIRAGREVRANVVGSRAEGVTTISLGGRPSDEFEYESLQQEVKKLQEEFNKLERQPDGPERRRSLPMVRMKLSVDKKRLEQFQKDLEKNGEGTKGQEGLRLTCMTAYAGTEIIINGVRHQLKYEVEPCTAVLRKGEIRLI